MNNTFIKDALSDIFLQIAKKVTNYIQLPLTTEQLSNLAQYVNYVYAHVFDSLTGSESYISQVLNSIITTILAAEDNHLQNSYKDGIILMLNNEDPYYTQYEYTKGLLYLHETIADRSKTIEIFNREIRLTHEEYDELVEEIFMYNYLMKPSNRNLSRLELPRIFQTFTNCCPYDCVDHMQYISYTAEKLNDLKYQTYNRIYRYIKQFIDDEDIKHSVDTNLELVRFLDDTIDHMFTFAFIFEEYDNMSKHTLDNLSQKAYDIAIQFMNIYYTFINLKQ